jgi:hypothetical protein
MRRFELLSIPALVDPSGIEPLLPKAHTTSGTYCAHPGNLFLVRHRLAASVILKRKLNEWRGLPLKSRALGASLSYAFLWLRVTDAILKAGRGVRATCTNNCWLGINSMRREGLLRPRLYSYVSMLSTPGPSQPRKEND